MVYFPLWDRPSDGCWGYIIVICETVYLPFCSSTVSIALGTRISHSVVWNSLPFIVGQCQWYLLGQEYIVHNFEMVYLLLIFKIAKNIRSTSIKHQSNIDLTLLYQIDVSLISIVEPVLSEMRECLWWLLGQKHIIQDCETVYVTLSCVATPPLMVVWRPHHSRHISRNH